MHESSLPAPADAVNLVGFALLEPQDPLRLYQPTWFNVWEALQYRKANAACGGKQWLFRRFGVDDEGAVSSQEALRKTGYRDWLNGLSDACQQAVAQQGAKQTFRLRQESSALFYVDSWGEGAVFEEVNSWRDAMSVDILPKNIVRDYGITDFTTKIRGERSGLMMALRLAQDMLNGGMVDNIIICAHYRAFPVLLFSEAAGWPTVRSRREEGGAQISVERLACLILRKSPGQGTALRLNSYHMLPHGASAGGERLAELYRERTDANTRMVLGATPPGAVWRRQQQKAFTQLSAQAPCVGLNALYGDSGCLNPALAWHHLNENGVAGHTLLSVLDGQHGVWLVDSWR